MKVMNFNHFPHQYSLFEKKKLKSENMFKIIRTFLLLLE